jgi:hypothetical protein
MQKPEPQEKARGSFLAIILAGSLGLAAVTGLVFITLGLFGPVLAIAGVIFGFAALHYVVWGWWLPRMIREEDEAERDAEARRDEQRRQ